MTILRHEFHQQADKAAKNPSPFSLRLTYAEKAQLLAEAGRKPLGVYIRERLFGQNAAPRKRQGNSPVMAKFSCAMSRMPPSCKKLWKAMPPGASRRRSR